jgi:pyruvate/2-oxoglutarate/acetoin dehydrogenase E1 component
MRYKEAVKQAMRNLSKDKKVLFIGYNIRYGSKGYGTFNDIEKSKLLETPLAENLMMGLAIGMSLEGYKPLVFFERHDFILNALDAIVNHLDKIEKLSHGQFKTPVIIRTVIGSKKPLNPGLQHTQDFTESLKRMIDFPIIELNKSSQIIEEYKKAINIDHPILFIEKKELYELNI